MVLVACSGALWHGLTHLRFVSLFVQAIGYTEKVFVLYPRLRVERGGLPKGHWAQRETTGSVARRPCPIPAHVLTDLHAKVVRGRVSYHEMQADA